MSDKRTLGIKMENSVLIEFNKLTKKHGIDKSALIKGYVHYVNKELKKVDDTTEGKVILLKILEYKHNDPKHPVNLGNRGHGESIGA